MKPEIELSVVESVDPDDLEALYSSVGWVSYTNDIPKLNRAVANSTYVVAARCGDDLVGLARGMSDDASLFYLQDILVRPDQQV